MDRIAEPSVRIHASYLSITGVLIFLLAGCGRTGLGLPDEPYPDEDAGIDQRVPTADSEVPGKDAPPQPTGCTPQDEECNGADDDCDGEVDEGIASIPCPGGGYRYCVAGTMSECPTRCDVCMPGSRRVCFLSYCKYWGRQSCSSDGQAFGTCREDDPPPECEATAENDKYSAKLEQCCLDAGYCCLDEWDLDHDGDVTDMLGRCDEVQCE